MDKRVLEQYQRRVGIKIWPEHPKLRRALDLPNLSWNDCCPELARIKQRDEQLSGLC